MKMGKGVAMSIAPDICCIRRPRTSLPSSSPRDRAFVYSLVSLVNCASAAKDAAEAEATRAAAVAKAEVERSVSC